MIEHGKLGKLEPKVDDRTLQLATYLEPALPPPPVSLDRLGLITPHLPAGWGMMGNDRLGDCTCAALGHAEQTWSALTKAEAKTPSDEAVEKLYWATGDGSGQDDTGRVEIDVLNYVRKHNLFHHKVYAYTQVGLHNQDLVKQAIAMFGLAYIGLALPLSAQGQPVWDVTTGPESEPGSWGGHAVILVQYDTFGPTCITWGQPLKMSWSFFQRYCDEAYALLESEWFAHGKSPAGLDRHALEADLEAIV